MRRARLMLAALIAGTALHAQTKPNRLEGQCSAELVQNLSLPCSTDEPCPLYLELAAAESVAQRIVISGNLHTGAHTVESLLLSSDDGGRTWTEAHSRIPQAVLDQIQFIDFEAGWINGHILQTTPKDAFFLLTTDGGKTWRRRPVTGESRTGAVDSFWFDSRNHGMLALDRVRAAENNFRYELWESQTGGESWSVRQVDTKPVPLPAPKREPSLRIRTDSAAKVHRLERRENNRWVAVASFQVSAGECRPPAAEVEKEPPPAPEQPAEPQPTTRPPGPKKPPSLRKPQ